MLRLLIGLFLLVVVVEGAIRKWFLPELSNAVFALKDVMLASAFAAFALSGQTRLPKSQAMVLWVAWVALAMAHAVIAGFSLQAIIGLRYYLAPLPLIVIIPALIRDPDDLDRLASWAVWLTFPIGALAIAQYFSPLDSPLNTYAWGGDEVSSFGNEDDGYLTDSPRARVTSTFSYISTYAAFLAASWLLAWLAVLRGKTAFDRWLAGAALLMIAFNMGMNGSRALVLVALLSGMPFAWMLLRKIGAVWGQVLVACLAAVVAYAGARIFEPFVLTVQRGDEAEALERIRGMLMTPLATLASVDFFGMGIGHTFGGFEQIGEQLIIEGFDEVNVDRIGIETGYVGYTLLLVIKFAMLAKSFGVHSRLRGHSLRPWALAALLIQFGSHWQIPFYNAVAAISYFSAIGLVYWLDERLRAGAVAGYGAIAGPAWDRFRVERRSQ